MKKLIKPATKEEHVYYSDFSGTCFGEWYPPVELKISFQYGSKHDGSEISLHLTDEELEPILKIIKESITQNYKDYLKSRIKMVENDYDNSMQMRDWDTCDHNINTLWLLKDLLNIKTD